MTDIEWADVELIPMRAPGYTKFNEFADELRKRKGHWAVYPGKITSEHSAECTTWVINTGRKPVLPHEEFEAAYEGAVVYVRARKRKLK